MRGADPLARASYGVGEVHGSRRFFGDNATRGVEIVDGEHALAPMSPGKYMGRRAANTKPLGGEELIWLTMGVLGKRCLVATF
jgi:hypothetical protein